MSSDLVRVWMEAFGREVDDSSKLQLAWELIEEEYKELCHEFNFGHIRGNFIKEAGDLIWVIKQMLWFMGVEPAEVERRIFNSNMSKMVNGRVEYREDGKVLKGPNYQAPDLSDL